MTAAIAWKYVRWVHEGADVTLVPSSASEYDLREAGVRRLARWGRGVDLERYHPNNRRLPGAVTVRERLSPDGEIVIGYVGRIAPEKQVERLRFLTGLPGVSVAIVGDGPAREAVERRLHGVPTTWLGRLGGAELAAAYAAFDAFAHTGSEETFGQTVQEAHASGLPVIAPRAGDRSTSSSTASTDCSSRRRTTGPCARRSRCSPPTPHCACGWARPAVAVCWGGAGTSLCSELIGHYERVILAACGDAGRRGVQPSGRQRAYS